MCWGRPHLFQIDISCTALGKQSKPCFFSCSLHTSSLALLCQGSQSIILYPPSPVSPLRCSGFPNNEMGTKEAFECYSEYYGELND